ncbi:hypothetical protein CLOSTHATH_01356 [Hungatella hathewayi DSM 13479]|uniref:Uncharacterized protein n=1 Tax=Hungatella hathewayi DSM 13479 TaxID=566550 RepID=D3ACM8_9FIRM|nr:hypothetical protein CLOSTHATH_01356 [Hungatella hathewayi DSM 13479]
MRRRAHQKKHGGNGTASCRFRRAYAASANSIYQRTVVCQLIKKSFFII